MGLGTAENVWKVWRGVMTKGKGLRDEGPGPIQLGQRPLLCEAALFVS